MQIKRYETNNLQEATIKIRRDLGPEAIILSTKKISNHPPVIEVIAARDDKPKAAVAPSPSLVRHEESGDTLSAMRAELLALKASIEGLRQASTIPCERQEFKEAIETLLDHASLGNPPPLDHLYMKLIANGLSRAKSFVLIEKIKKTHPLESMATLEKGLAIAEGLVSRSLSRDRRPGKRVKALIGPTGVGKTTTIAKLAAHYRLDRKWKVGLITTDTYRIAAVEQLKVYGKIMDLPVQIVSDQTGFLQAIANFAAEDVILVDTPGRNPQDDRGIGQVRTLFNDAVETQLVISPTANNDYLTDTANRLKVFNYDSLILTKVDECLHLGSLYDFLEEVGDPVSYITTGQNVPYDIEPATPARLAQLIIHNRLN